MLAWKWWRDCRGRVLLYLGAALAFGIFAALDATSYNWWMDNVRNDPQRFQFYVFLSWNGIRYSLMSPAFYGAVWAGLALAISSTGRDYASSGANFLLTRPQARAAMVWVDCGLAVGTVALSGVFLVGSAMAIATFKLPYIRPEALLGLLPILIAVAMVIYGLTMFWIVTTRSAVKGVELSLATILATTLVPGAALEWWHIAWPGSVRMWMLKIFDWQPVYSYWITRPHVIHRPGIVRYYVDTWRPVMYRNVEPYPIGVLVIWIAVGLAFVYASQKVLENREV